MSIIIGLTGCGSRRAVQELDETSNQRRIQFDDQKVSIALADFSDIRDQTDRLPAEIIQVYAKGSFNFIGDRVKVTGPPVLGSLSIRQGELIFEPRFPFERGKRYLVLFNPQQLPSKKAGAVNLVETFELAKPDLPATEVTAVYPTRDRLPENQLKFYLHFSAPMSRGEAYDHIRLLDAAGKPVAFPFLELNEELWDPAGRRFTLFFDPGRIKRGLKPREEVGPALEEGKNYTLVIDRGWTDAAGNPLKADFRKSFAVDPPDDAPVDPKTWKVIPPAAGKNGPLTVQFPKSLDHALLNRMIWVTDADGKRLEGTTEVGKQEMSWSFIPNLPWRAGDYQLVADTTLEDLAGNNIARPFEVDVLRPIERETKVETIRIPFRVEK